MISEDLAVSAVLEEDTGRAAEPTIILKKISGFRQQPTISTAVIMRKHFMYFRISRIALPDGIITVLWPTRDRATM